MTSIKAWLGVKPVAEETKVTGTDEEEPALV